MALPLNKSSLVTKPLTDNPNLGRPLNPSPRSSEVANPMRRSFTGNPFSKPSIVANQRGFNSVTPANSPSEFPRRRESIPTLQDHEEKENGKDLCPNIGQARVRSPGIKGTKHFMSPTISAASKVNASPRKKILSERNNDSVRSSSASISDLRSSSSSVNVSEAPQEMDTKVTAEASRDSGVTDLEEGHQNSSTGLKGSRKKVAFDSIVHEIPVVESVAPVETDADLVNIDEEFTNPISPSPLAPLDADPLVPLPPYDHKTNYLSPRPQFLHYRPSPRIKHYLGEDGKIIFDSLEGGFDLDSPSETDVTSEEASQSEKESSDDASSNEAKADEASLESGPVKISEECVVETDKAETTEETVETGRSFFKRSKFILPVFMVLLACAALVGTHYSPVRDQLTINGLSFPIEAGLLRVKIAENTRLWYDNSLSYFSALVSEFRGTGSKWDELQFYNLTDLEENPWLGKQNMLGSPIQADVFENLDVVSNLEEEIEYLETEEYVATENGADEGDEVLEDGPKEQQEDAFSKDEPLQIEAEQEETYQIEAEQEPAILEVNPNEASEAGMEIIEMKTEATAENHGAVQIAETEIDQLELLPVEVEANDQFELPRVVVESNDPEADERSIIQLEDHDTASFPISAEPMEHVDSSGFIAPAAAVLLASVAAAAASLVFWIKRTLAAVPSAKENHQRQHFAKKANISPIKANRTTDFDVIGIDSCPSEMSSFQENAYSYHSKGAKSGLRKKSDTGKSLRRESTASSYSDLSLGSSSPSYGSFTTYEMIANKHRKGDEELVITPIRRSSRLRKQATSP